MPKHENSAIVLQNTKDHPMKLILIALTASLIATPSLAGEAKVVDAKAVKSGNTWRFDVTIKHADTGWENYADGWGVYLANGTELGYRVLVHPHVNEQPFTRSLSGVKIPKGTQSVVIVPRDKVHGLGKDFIVDLK
jgi:hypothetical protein